MGAISAVRWESMKAFDPAGFSHFDIMNDDIYPSDLASDGNERRRIST
jgi:hypothetical protein